MFYLSCLLGFLIGDCVVVIQALPNQQTVDYPSFKLVIVGDGGTGNLFNLFILNRISGI